jgi:spermidine/putrescine-binding protein
MVGNGSAVATMTTSAGSITQTQNGSISRFSPPANNDPIVVWAQQAAIMRDAKNVEAAKLYINWVVDSAKNSVSFC